MSNEDKTPKQQVAEHLTGGAFFIRHRAFRLMDEVGLDVPQAVAVAMELNKIYETGKDTGESRALYAYNPDSWPWGRVVHVHKIWDMLVLEYEVRGEPGEYRYTAQAGRDNHWGKPRKDMHAAIADALGFKHDGDMSTAGEYIIRMLDIQED